MVYPKINACKASVKFLYLATSSSQFGCYSPHLGHSYGTALCLHVCPGTSYVG